MGVGLRVLAYVFLLRRGPKYDRSVLSERVTEVAALASLPDVSSNRSNEITSTSSDADVGSAPILADRSHDDGALLPPTHSFTGYDPKAILAGTRTACVVLLLYSKCRY